MLSSLTPGADSSKELDHKVSFRKMSLVWSRTSGFVSPSTL